MNINSLPYHIGDAVYLVTDPDQFERLITGIIIRQDGILYELSQSSSVSSHFDFEITNEKNCLKSL